MSVLQVGVGQAEADRQGAEGDEGGQLRWR